MVADDVICQLAHQPRLLPPTRRRQLEGAEAHKGASDAAHHRPRLHLDVACSRGQAHGLFVKTQSIVACQRSMHAGVYRARSQVGGDLCVCTMSMVRLAGKGRRAGYAGVPRTVLTQPPHSPACSAGPAVAPRAGWHRAARNAPPHAIPPGTHVLPSLHPKVGPHFFHHHKQGLQAPTTHPPATHPTTHRCRTCPEAPDRQWPPATAPWWWAPPGRALLLQGVGGGDGGRY